MRLTLGELLDQPDFGLELLSGGERARLTPVEGAHSIDLRDPVRWLQEGWIMLTTGVQLRGSVSAQRRLVAQLAEGRIAALGLGVGIALRRVPAGLLDEAARRDFPVFAVPLETPFREIISFVNRSALNTDLYLLRRLTSMQRYLLDAMHQPLPDQALVERLASLLGGADVAYLDPAGSVVAATGANQEWRDTALRHASANVPEFEAGSRWGLVVQVTEGNVPVGWLAVLLSSAGVSRQVARPVVRTAGELLGLVSAARLSAGRATRARRDRLGARLLRVMAGHRDDGLPAELAAVGIDFTRECRVAVVTAAGGADGVRAALDGMLEAGDGDVVLAADGYEVVMLAQGDLAGLGEWLRSEQAPRAVHAGVSEPLGRLEDVGVAVAQARLALAVARDGPGTAVQHHEDLEPSVALLGPTLAADSRLRLRAALAPLDEEPRLRAAVVAYLEAGLDVGRAAQALGLHRNSIRYRLDRAEHILGRSLRSPGTITAIHLALLAERLEVPSSKR